MKSDCRARLKPRTCANYKHVSVLGVGDNVCQTCFLLPFTQLSSARKVGTKQCHDAVDDYQSKILILCEAHGAFVDQFHLTIYERCHARDNPTDLVFAIERSSCRKE